MSEGTNNECVMDHSDIRLPSSSDDSNGEEEQVHIPDQLGVQSTTEMNTVTVDVEVHEVEIEKEQKEDNNEPWKEVVSRKKKQRVEKFDVCISSQEPLPKQFALAKLFCSKGIINIDRVKYLNAYKVLVTFNNEESCEQLISCENLHNWRIFKSWEVNISYGIIRNIELDLTEDDLLQCLRNSNDCEIVSVKRLRRRMSDYTGWTESETLRIGFKGGSVPEYLYLFNLKIKVDLYIFPVTQCSNCWRFGHSSKICPSLKKVCPKCSKNHANCETTSYTCVNCRGNHMALVKSCPTYIKEKKVREMMSQFNCTYRKAATMYVPPFSPQPPPQHEEQTRRVYSNPFYIPTPQQFSEGTSQPISTYASVTAKPKSNSNKMKQTQKSSKRKQHFSSDQSVIEWDMSSLSSETSVVPEQTRNNNNQCVDVSAAGRGDASSTSAGGTAAAAAGGVSAASTVRPPRAAGCERAWRDTRTNVNDKGINYIDKEGTFMDLLNELKNIILINKNDSWSSKFQRNNQRDIKINILQWNAQSLQPKRKEFEALLHQEKIHFAIVSETWFDPDRDVRINGYNVFRKDRRDGYAGVALMTHWSIQAQEVNINISNPALQVICCKISNCHQLENIIGVYCPSGSTSISDWDNLFSFCGNKTIIAGDFNGHHSTWSSKTCSRGQQIFDAAMDNNFIPINDGTYTRVRLRDGVVHRTAPDVSLVSTDVALMFKWKVMNESLGSDHFMIKMSLDIQPSTTFTERRNYKKANWQGYEDSIEQELNNTSIPLDDQQAYDYFVDIINRAADKHIPISKIYHNPLRPNKFRPKPYWNSDISLSVAKRRRSLAEFRRNPTPANLIVLQDKIRDSQAVIRRNSRNSWQNLCSSVDGQTSSSEMWSRMRWIKGYSVTRPSVDFSAAEQLMCDLAPDYASPSKPQFLSTNHHLSEPISVQELNNCLKHSDSAPGMDNISYSMINNLSVYGKQVFVSLLNRFILNGFVPKQWKHVKIVPIPKPANENRLPGGIRPIALLSCPCKILHSILTRRLEWFLEKIECFSSETIGFRRSKSCMDNLTRLVSYIQKGYTDGTPTVGCFIDIDSAYNNINVTSLLTILENLGVGSVLCNYLWEYLHDRNLSLQLNSNVIINRSTGIGIAQGDPLSPLLFNVATSKICKQIGRYVFISQYADDFVLCYSNRSISIAISKVHDALNIFCKLIEELGLNISYRKTKLCIFSRGHRRNIDNMNLKHNNQTIQNVHSVRYLGMRLDNNLKWGTHINEVRDKTLKFMGILKVLAGTKWGIHPKHLRNLYIALIRSRMDYGSFLYDTSVKSHLYKLDKVQNQAMRVIGGFIKSTPIHSMEVELCIPPLKVRRTYLAGKFYFRSKSLDNNPTITIINELNESCHNRYWRNKKLPLLVDTHRHYSNQQIHSAGKLPMFLLPNWLSYYDLMSFVCVDIEGINVSKRSLQPTEIRGLAQNVISTRYLNHYQLFTDGSKDEYGCGAAFFDAQCNIKIKLQILEKLISVMHCELIAISECLSYILSIDGNYFVVFSDSKSALLHLARLSSNCRGHPIAFIILETICKLKEANKTVMLQWIPSHVGIDGNEVADLAAKEAITDGVPYNCFPVHSEALMLVGRHCRKDWAEYFDERSKYKGIWYKTIQCDIPRYPWFADMKRSRTYLVILFRLRSGHIPSNKFKHLMRKSDTPNCTECNVIEDVQHVLMECVRNQAIRRELNIVFCNIGSCNSVLASPLSDEVKILIRMYKFIFS